MKKTSSGFSLAELLIVLAILAVLTAVAIPLFNNHLEKSREATDIANVRSASAEVKSAGLSGDRSDPLYDSFLDQYIKRVDLCQTEDGWISPVEKLNIGGITPEDKAHWKGDHPRGKGQCEVIFDPESAETTLIWNGYTLYPNYQWKSTSDTLSPGNTSYNAEKWPASAIPVFIPAKNNSGEKLVVDSISEKYPTLKKWLDEGHGYEIGYFIADKNGKILYDSGGKYLKSDSALSFDITTNKAAQGESVNLALQFFKMKSGSQHNQGSEVMTEAEARELERVFTIKSK